MTDPSAIARCFLPRDQLATVTPHGGGLVNDSYCLTTTGGQRFLLQRLNQAVFPSPQQIMRNLRLVSDHLHRQRHSLPAHWRLVDIIPTLAGNDYCLDQQDDCWRLLSFLDQAVTLSTVASTGQAREIGAGLGRFHRLLADLDCSLLAPPLPGFHVTPHYLARYQRAATGAGPGRNPEERFCRRFIAERRSWAGVLEAARRANRLTLRPIHGDPKLDNFLFDQDHARVVALIDLDTVMAGLLHYDIGDCLRSCCNLAGEDPAEPERVRFDPDTCRAVLAGYGTEMARQITRADLALLYDAIRLIPFELGVRFYTDYLLGNPYFRVRDPEQNLRRAMVQFRLTASIETQQHLLRRLIAELESCHA